MTSYDALAAADGQRSPLVDRCWSTLVTSHGSSWIVDHFTQWILNGPMP
jgi:hypothetical protein